MASLTVLDMESRSAPVAKSKGWIKKATAGAHGQFRRKAEAAGETTRQFAAEHAGDSGTLGKQARLAQTLMGMSHGGGGEKKPRHGGFYDRKKG